jgi:hypothetical protein
MNEMTMHPDAINPPHDVRDSDKLATLRDSLATNGWVGRAIPVYDNGTLQALTGSHRIAAAREADVRVTIYQIDANVMVDDGYGTDVPLWEMLDRATDDDARMRALESAGEEHAAALLREEIRLNEEE